MDEFLGISIEISGGLMEDFYSGEGILNDSFYVLSAVFPEYREIIYAGPVNGFIGLKSDKTHDLDIGGRTIESFLVRMVWFSLN